MRREDIPDQTLLEAWPKLGYFALYELAKKGLDDVGLRNYRIRQRLVETVRHLDIQDAKSRIELAMGKLKFLDHDSQRSWWDFIRHDLELVDIATKKGLHVGYMLPATTDKYLEDWLEAGGRMHKAAQMMWDRTFRHGNQFHLPAILCPRYFNAEHMEQWRDRALASWQGACPEAKRRVFDQMAVHVASSSAPPSPEVAGRKRWALRWLEDLLDGSPTTRQAVQEWLVGPIGRSGVDPEIEGMLCAHISVHELACSTQPAPQASRGPRL